MPSFMYIRASTVARLARKDLSRLIPYRGGKSLDEVERATGRRNFVKLASNENPLGPSPKALKAMRAAISEAHLYPEMGYPLLKGALAKSFGLSRENFLLGNGSNEVLVLAASAFLRPGDEAVMASPSFAVFRHAVTGAGARAVCVPLKDYRHDLPAMARATGPRTRAVFVCNPNNPTGTTVGREELERFFRAIPGRLICVLDEAYAEFASDKDFPHSIRYVRRGLGVLGVRTFAKLHGLAGLRIGYGIGHARIIGALESLRQPFNVNAIAYRAALAAMADRKHARRTLILTARERRWLTRQLIEIGLKPVPSQTNFILVRLGMDGATAAERMLRDGVIVRALPGRAIRECVRITIGTRSQNIKAVRALRKIRKSGRRR